MNGLHLLMNIEFAAQIADVFRNDFRGMIQGRAKGAQGADHANDQEGRDRDPLKRQRSTTNRLFHV